MSLENENTWDTLFDEEQDVSDVKVTEDDDDVAVVQHKPADVDFIIDDDDYDADKADDKAGAPAKKTTDKDGNEDDDPDEKDKDASTKDTMSGIERYLSRYDIEGGMIKFDDGTEKHFNDLDAGKQEEILETLHGSVARSVEEKYGLDETEVGLINYLRTNNLTFDEVVEARVSERLSKLSTETVDLSGMADDDIYKMYMKKTVGDGASESDIEADLEVAKSQSTFKALAQSMRAQLKRDAEAAVEAAAALAREKDAGRIEEDRRTIIQAVTPLKVIAGVELTNNLKNEVLDKVLNVTDDGDSLFQDEILSDPTKLFSAAFWYYNGESLLEQRDNYWKKEKSAAYKRGRESVLGKSSSPISFTSNEAKPSGRKTTRDEDIMDLDELHND
jgi:hypothetical protein